MSTSWSSNPAPAASIRSSSARASSQRWQSGRAYSRTIGTEDVMAQVVGIGYRLRAPGRGAGHRRVIGAELDRDELQLQPQFATQLGHAAAQLGVGRDTAAQSDRPPLARRGCPPQLGDELVGNRPLVAGGQVGDRDLGSL